MNGTTCQMWLIRGPASPDTVATISRFHWAGVINKWQVRELTEEVEALR